MKPAAPAKSAVQRDTPGSTFATDYDIGQMLTRLQRLQRLRGYQALQLITEVLAHVPRSSDAPAD